MILFFWGLPPSAAGPFQGSQVCSALRQQAGWVCRCAAPFQAPRPAAASPPARCGCRLKPAAIQQPYSTSIVRRGLKSSTALNKGYFLFGSLIFFFLPHKFYGNPRAKALGY
ncbi:hypothetical protein SGRA_3582 [Saprospira grandis str. Lewin]|uniref:Uncharacterized protein n=1 Tax=Saprospira grandis (strain Lewin) TaxID=984262 RepID=H6L5Q6_SAPGL|nr:hypothetical protein SGRA_3582 [Saprospira grandis str. Lewin]